MIYRDQAAKTLGKQWDTQSSNIFMIEPFFLNRAEISLISTSSENFAYPEVLGIIILVILYYMTGMANRIFTFSLSTN